VVAGTTGEAAALAPDERGELVAAVREAVPRDVAVKTVNMAQELETLSFVLANR